MILAGVVYDLMDERCEGRRCKNLQDVLGALDAVPYAYSVEETGVDKIPTCRVDGTKMEEVRSIGDIVYDFLNELDREVMHDCRREATRNGCRVLGGSTGGTRCI